MAKKEKEEGEEIKVETPLSTEVALISSVTGITKLRLEGMGVYIEFPASILCMLQNMAECPRVISFIEKCKQGLQDPSDFSLTFIPTCQKWCSNYTRIDLPELLKNAKVIQKEEK